MTGVPPIDREGRTSATARRAERRGWFARPKDFGPAPDQEAEVRARLYAKPPPTERTVERIERIERIERVERVDPFVQRPAA
jgi:hypothetical protein